MALPYLILSYRFIFDDLNVHERACKDSGVFAVPADHFAGGPCCGKVNVYSNSSFGQWLNVTFGAYEFEVFVDDRSLELRRAIVITGTGYEALAG